MLTGGQIANVNSDMLREGYVQVGGLFDRDRALALAQNIVHLRARGLLPVFALVYDEFWWLAKRLNPLLSNVLGAGYAQLPDVWAWHLDPATEERGWAPHRDKAANDCLTDAGAPKSVTTWIALTDVTPLNGCMYIVPAHMDPGYADGAMPRSEDILQGVRALPGSAGTVFMWNQRVLHWGGSSSRRAAMPRVSIAFEFQRGDVPPFNEPLLRNPHIYPDFKTRLSLIGKQICQYTHMYGYSDDLVQAAEALMDE